MRIKLDENLPFRLVQGLRQLGHQADTVQSEGLVGSPDAQVWEAAVGRNATGTYARAIPFGGLASPFGGQDGYLVLYLLWSGSYLFAGHWRGYELIVAAGHWREHDNRVTLDGVGVTLYIDVHPFSRALRPHMREFEIKMQQHTPVLIAESEHKEWSLLGWLGPFYYLGRSHFVPLLDSRLPTSWESIEPWVQRFVARPPGESR